MKFAVTVASRASASASTSTTVNALQCCGHSVVGIAEAAQVHNRELVFEAAAQRLLVGWGDLPILRQT